MNLKNHKNKKTGTPEQVCRLDMPLGYFASFALTKATRYLIQVMNDARKRNVRCTWALPPVVSSLTSQRSVSQLSTVIGTTLPFSSMTINCVVTRSSTVYCRSAVITVYSSAFSVQVQTEWEMFLVNQV